MDEGFREMYAVLREAEHATAAADTVIGQVEDGERGASLALAVGIHAVAKALVALNYRIGYEATKSREERSVRRA
jgi:hypothetical protein